MARYDRYGGRAIFVGNLPIDVREKELDEIFYKFGRIRMIDIKKPSRPPGFAFIEFDSPSSAEEAARRRNGYEFANLRMRVEIARGGDGASVNQPLRTGYRPIRNTMGYRLYVKGLPRTASWQDLKDFVRRVCKPLYTEVFKDERDNVFGVVEFETRDDMKAAMRKLDDSEFSNPFDKGVYVRLVEELDDRGGRDRDRDRERDRERDSDRERERERDRGRSRSPRRERERDRDERKRSKSKSRSRSRSRSRSPARSKSKSRSRSRSPAKSKSRSRSRTRSRSRSRSPAADNGRDGGDREGSPRPADD